MKNYVLLVILFLFSCANSRNNKTAKIIVINNERYLRLTGKRVPLVHDPFSALKSKAVNDTLLLPLPFIGNGVIEGKDISVKEGYYKYTGFVLIKSDSVIINLSLVNTDKNKLVPELYNGAYILVK